MCCPSKQNLYYDSNILKILERVLKVKIYFLSNKIKEVDLMKSNNFHMALIKHDFDWNWLNTEYSYLAHIISEKMTTNHIFLWEKKDYKKQRQRDS